MKGSIKLILGTSFLCIFSMIQSMDQGLPQPIEDASLQFFKFKCEENEFLTILKNLKNSSIGEQNRVLSEQLFRRQLSQQDLLIATCFTIFHQQSSLASRLLQEINNVHAHLENFSVIKKHPETENAFREYHFKWTPLCFAIIKWNQHIMEALRNKGTSCKDIQSSKGFLTWLTDTVSAEDITQRLSTLTEMGIPGQISDTDFVFDFLPPSSLKKGKCIVQ